MSRQTAIRLPDETYERLQTLAARTGRTTAFYIREALSEHLDDLEDVYLAEQVIERIQDGKEKVLTAEEFWRGLDD
ncbi:DUF6290 family protein [Ochrobactrum sp. GPK 3]|uniref:type II toxin-antitoxin system RelB family antitoxin n=1 Tax=Brucella sp. 22210 TaxID=3453892 RepID=UPI0031385820